MKSRELVLSLTKDDFEVQTFRSGGKGGQHQNTTESGVRIIHKESGISHEARSHRSQHENKREAFKKFATDPKFKIWLNRRLMNMDGIERSVDELMIPSNIKTEVIKNGRWTEVDDLEDDI